MAGISAVAAAGAGIAVPGVARAGKAPLRVQIVMFEGVEEQDFAGPYEVFSLAGRLSGGALSVSYTTGGRPRAVTAAFGTKVAVEQGWSPRSADLVVVPAGGSAGRTSRASGPRSTMVTCRASSPPPAARA
jgi:putative intracellular protease/amidase